MAVQHSVAVRNARADAKETAIGASAKLQLWTGSPPASCAASDSGTMLAEFALASDWATAASGGVKAFAAVTPVNAVAGGIVGHYRIKDSTGATCHEQGTVTLTGGGGDLTIDNTTTNSGQEVQVPGWTVTEPGA